MADNGAVKIGGTTSPKPPANENAGPIIKESQESAEYQQDLQVVLGTAFGVIAMVGLIALAFLLYRVYHTRRTALSYGQNDDTDVFERDIIVDVDNKSQPVILLLYAYDCPIHEQVVGALASFLMEACGVIVTLDLLEETEILGRGVDDWLVDRLQEADYILVLCSLGARLRCSKKRVRFKSDDCHALPDYFAVAVDYVAEKMRAEKHKGLSMNKFVTAFMEYSTRSDIPPQLETASQFCLMKDIHKLHIHLNTHGPDKGDSASQASTCESHYHETETGALLKATIEQAKTYFKDNPTWLEDRLEIASSGAQVRGSKARKHRQNPMEEPLLTLMGTPPVLEHPPSQLAPNLSQQTRDRLRQTNAFHTLPRTNDTFELPEYKQTALDNTGIFQSRQNSLPSSLASSCLTAPSTRHALSRSMDSFAVDHSFHPDHEGLPCFYCNSTHMDGRPECRQTDLHQGQVSTNCLASTDLSTNHGQTSLHILARDLGPSRSQTVLQAEVHQEWSNSNRGTPEQKSATLAGDPRSWNTTNCAPIIPAPYQSLPPHQPPPNPYSPSTSALMEWDTPVGLRKWSAGYPDSPNFKMEGQGNRLAHRSLSNVSVSTDDSGSLSDGDLLERDLRSIQNISSFYDFVTTSSFTNGTYKTFAPSTSTSMEMGSVLKPFAVFVEPFSSNTSNYQCINTVPAVPHCVENV